MVRNEEKYEQAVLFRKRGFTLEEIAKICGVSKSTVSKWLKDMAFSANVTKQNKRRAGQENAKRLKLINKARSGERRKQYDGIERAATTEFKHYKDKSHFIAGLMAYRSHGDLKNPAQIRFSSADQFMHQVFLYFTLEYLGADKEQVKHWLLLYKGQSESVSMKRWRKALSLPYSQFHKTQYTQTKKTKHTLHNGVGNTIIGSTVLKRKLVTWLKLLEKDLTK